MAFYVGQRVIVTKPEHEFEYIDAGAEIPVGTTGIIERISDGSCIYEPTGESTHWVTIVFDLPWEDNGNWSNDHGKAKWDLYLTMIAPYDEECDAWEIDSETDREFYDMLGGLT